DQQVKIRGVRIELEEVRTILLTRPGIADAVVSTADIQGIKKLVPYVILEPEFSQTASGLFAHFKGRAPDYMIPSRFIFIDKFPRTPNGKIDRKALPAPV